MLEDKLQYNTTDNQLLKKLVIGRPFAFASSKAMVFVMLNGSEASPLGRYKTLRYLRVTRTLLFTFLSC